MAQICLAMEDGVYGANVSFDYPCNHLVFSDAEMFEIYKRVRIAAGGEDLIALISCIVR